MAFVHIIGFDNEADKRDYCSLLQESREEWLKGVSFASIDDEYPMACGFKHWQVVVLERGMSNKELQLHLATLDANGRIDCVCNLTYIASEITRVGQCGK